MGICLDRFAQGLPDPQEAEVLGYCDACGLEIYVDGDVWMLDDGGRIHPVIRCLKRYVGVREMDAEEAFGP